MLIYHFSKKQISGIKVISILAILLSLASIYGVLRETVTYDESGLKLNWGTSCSDCDVAGSDELYKSEWMFAGLFPLERVFEAEENIKKMGRYICNNNNKLYT